MFSTDKQIIEGTSRRFTLALFIVHPTLSPAEITAEIGLQPHFVHTVGERRTTPAGALLPGKYKETRWRYRTRHEVDGQWFVQELEDFVNRLSPCAEFFGRATSAGGRACLIVSFLGDGHFGDTLPAATLVKIARLHLNLGIEVYSTPQA